MSNKTFPGEPGKPDLELFEDLSAPEPEDASNMFEELSGAGDDPLISEYSGGRIMPHPITGVPTKFPRASGFAISDETILTAWKIAMAVLGVTKNRDLYALGNSERLPKERMALRPKGWWKPWERIGRLGMERADSSSGAHEGTAFHAYREQIEAGEITRDDVPEEWQPHVDRFLEMHAASAMEVVPEYVEQLVVTLKLHNGVCGRLDNLRRLPDGRLILDDTKTGKNAPAGLDEMGIQFAIYANAEYWWRPDDPNAVNGYIPAPLEIRKDVATVSWVPIDFPENGRIIPIDIVWGWRAAQVAAWLKGYWNRSKRKNNGLELPLSAVWNEEMAKGFPATKLGYAQRITACTSLEELSGVYLEMAVNTDPDDYRNLVRLAEARKVTIKAQAKLVKGK